MRRRLEQMQAGGQAKREIADARMCRGIWYDEVWKRTEDGSEALVEKTKKNHNIIVQPFTVLVAGLLAGDPSFLGGILFHAIGVGDSAWDTSGIPDPSKFATTLQSEVSRLQPDGISYLKWGQGKAQSGTSSTIVDPSRVDGCGLVGRFEPDGFFDGMTVEITAGTNAGESRVVSSYVQETGEITVATPFSAPVDSTTEYEFVPEVSIDPTNVIEIRTTWDYGNPSDPFNFKYIREQGLFGGTATATTDSGLMVDLIHHNRIWKDPTIKIVRFIDIVLRV